MISITWYQRRWSNSCLPVPVWLQRMWHHRFHPIKLTMMVSVFVSAPMTLYQVWAFIAPALYKHERRLMVPLLISSSLLFYLGMAFAYFVVFHWLLAFCQNSARKRTDSDRYHQIPRFCHGALYGLWYFFRSSDRDHSLVLGGCNNTRSIEEKAALCVCRRFCCGDAPDTSRCAVPNTAGYSDVSVIWSWCVLARFIPVNSAVQLLKKMKV